MSKRALGFVVAALALAMVAGTQATSALAGPASTQAKKFKLPYSGSVSSGSTAFKVTNTGSGRGIDAFANNNTALLAESDAPSPGEPGVWGQSLFNYGVEGIGETGSSFAGVYGNSPRNGVYGLTSSSSDSGVYGENGGGGPGVAGYSASGPGGEFTGGGGSDPAIRLANGGIQIAGAGVDTATAVFTHLVANSNLCMSNDLTVLDNPYLNNNPNAFIFFQNSTIYGLVADYNAPTCPAGHWEVFQTDPNGAVPWVTGRSFTVLVLDP